MVNSLLICWFLPGGREKGCIEGFKKIPFIHNTYVLAKWCKVYAKTDSWFQKSHEKFAQLQISSGKPKKLKFDGLLLSKKCISPKNRLLLLKHIQNIYLTLLSTTCVKIHQINYVIFETISHRSRYNSSMYLFSSNITYFLRK